ncbi:hypothetical protein [Geoglobus acetivorans]|uniref:Uncharacterized protein n=1 Tax=Geoglobus acetivorans TaxID=565033 RepID=A0A0A7GHC7_GEOAI|nr:hypothetical protein GACE_1255 [Geoglobus acetivorans]
MQVQAGLGENRADGRTIDVIAEYIGLKREDAKEFFRLCGVVFV